MNHSRVIVLYFLSVPHSKYLAADRNWCSKGGLSSVSIVELSLPVGDDEDVINMFTSRFRYFVASQNFL